MATELSKRIANNTPDQKTLDRRLAVKDRMKEIFDLRKDQFRSALGTAFTPDFFLGFMRAAVSGNEQLQECFESAAGTASIYAAAMKCAQLRLIPNTDLGQIYLIGYRDNKQGGIMTCQAQIGRSGWVALVMRNPGFIEMVDAVAVYENDTFEHDLPHGIVTHVRGKERARDRNGAPIVKAAYAFIRWKSGGYTYEVLEREDLERSRARSKGNSFGWKDFPDRMAQRSALVRLLKVWGSATANADVVQALLTDDGEGDAPPILTTETDGTPVNSETGEIVDAAYTDEEPPPPEAPQPPATKKEKNAVILLRAATSAKVGKSAVEGLLRAAGAAWDNVEGLSPAEVDAFVAQIQAAGEDNKKS